jgi:hypothetical protein
MNEFIYLANKSNNKEINLQIIKSFAALILTLKNNITIYYLFSGNFINQIISNHFEQYDEDFLSYYVNFLKSLSMKIDLTTIRLFFHEETNSFPLLETSLKLYNHPDPMIKNVIRNIFLTFAKLNHPPLYKYLRTLPVISYFTFLCSRLTKISVELNKLNGYNVDKKFKFDYEQLKNLHDDFIDEILYFQDIFSLGLNEINHILINCLFYYFICPILINTIISDNRVFIAKHFAVYLIAVLIYNIKNETFLNVLISFIYSPKLNQDIYFNYIQSFPTYPTNFNYTWEEQKKFQKLNFCQFITYNYTYPFLLSQISNSNSSYSEIKILHKTYEEILNVNPDFNLDDPKNKDVIINEILNNLSQNEKNEMYKYHDSISMGTGVQCGLSDQKYKLSILNILSDQNQVKNVSENIIRKTLFEIFLKGNDELLIFNVNILLYVTFNKMEISQELLSQYKLSPYRNWCCNINQNDLSDLLDVLSKMKPTQEKTKIGIEINENNLNLKKTENDIFDNNYYKIKYKLSQNEYDENLVKTLLELLNSKQFCFIEPLLISYNLRSIFISTGKHSPIKEEDKNLICKIIYSYISNINNLLSNNSIQCELAYELFSFNWSLYNSKFDFRKEKNDIEKYLLTPYYFVKPSFKDDVEDYPFSNLQKTTENFKYEIFVFMTLNDLIQSINGNETELILDKFPIENGYYEFENEKDFNDELLEKNGKHYTKMKKTYNNEFDAFAFTFYKNFIYFLKEDINLLDSSSSYKLIKKLSLRNIEVSLTNKFENGLIIYYASKGNYSEITLQFSDDDTRKKIKNLLETKRKEARLWEKEQIINYFSNQSKIYKPNN